MFLSDADLLLLTGYRRHSCQRRALGWSQIADGRLSLRQIKTQTMQEFSMNDDLASVRERPRPRPSTSLVGGRIV